MQVIEIMRSPSVGVDDVFRVFPFELDACQKDAIRVVMGGESLVVSAPTGSGKTAIAEAATVYALARCSSMPASLMHINKRLAFDASYAHAHLHKDLPHTWRRPVWSYLM